ncbi:MAG: helix-turn-helix domain-containing protein [Christensenellales bacterium]
MLSQQYHINTSTLKSLFKTVYGQPLAAHMKEHRMEYAARLLRTTTDSLAEIAERSATRAREADRRVQERLWRSAQRIRKEKKPAALTSAETIL